MVGIKVVELLNNRGIRTTLADMAPRMFPLAAYESVSREIERRITRKGVQLALGSALASVEETGDGFVCSMTDGSTVQADLIVLCIGTRTNVSLVDPAEVTVNKGIVVDHDMQTSVPGIYAAGDCCDAFETQSRTVKNLALWLNSMQQGRVAGNCMTGGDARFGANVSLSLAHYLHYDFFCIGDVSICKEADELYEYEDEHLYIRGVRDADAIKCLNVIGSSESNGIL